MGKQIEISRVAHVIIGVLPRVVWPGTTELATKYTEAGVVLPPFAGGVGRHLEDRSGAGFFFVVGRLRDGVRLDRGRAALERTAAILERRHGVNRGYSLSIETLPEYSIKMARGPLWLLYGAVCCVLLIACVNVVHLVLARLASRHRELVLRASLGAGRTRLIRQLATESIVLSLIGAGCGLVLAAAGARALVTLAPSDLRGLEDAGVDWRVVAVTLGLGLAVGLATALLPVFSGAILRGDLLKTRAASGELPVLGRRARPPLVVAEVALSLVLLTGATLMVRSFARISQFEWGFNSEKVLTVPLQLGSPPEGVAAYTGRLLEAVSSVPGLEAAGGIDILSYPKTGENLYPFEVEGTGRITRTEVFIDSVTPGIFGACRSRSFAEGSSTDGTTPQHPPQS